MTINQLIKNWQNQPEISENLVYWQTNPEKSAIYQDLPAELHPDLIKALTNLGITRLYSHQVEAFLAANRGENVSVVTGTASGKTLCYNLPIVQTALIDEKATALYLFPTKALAQDQLTSIKNLIQFTQRNIPVSIYDGDTSSSLRKSIRENSRLLLSNPDMLHIAILPHHTLWSNFLQNLRFVVIDEIHTYRGVFGSHIANLIRRLKRITRFYGTEPQFIMTSATIANPLQFSKKLIEMSVTLIDQDGSPKGARHFVMYNPPIVQPELGIRRSSLTESTFLVSDLMAYDIQTLVFVRSRRSLEQVLVSLRERNPLNREELRGYRSGYLPRERRMIEQGLREASVRTVVATNALELGVDIGGMEAVVLVGYPGTIAATRQQSGRAGRRKESSLSVLVASSSPIDQFLMKHPEFIIDKSPEQALIAPDNLLILLDHLRCAAFELPFKENESFGNLSSQAMQELLAYLVDSNILHRAGDSYFWAADQYPANSISIRSASGQTILLQAHFDDQWSTIGEVDQESAKWMVHPQAVYIHEGELFLVESLNFEEHIARLEPANPDYYTEPRSNASIELVEKMKEEKIKGGNKYFGEIQVTEQIIGYRKIKWFTREILADYPLDMPPSHLRTNGFWFSLGEEAVGKLRELGLWKNDPNDYGPSWNTIRKTVRQRDQFTCQVCGIKEAGEAHHVHHKIPLKNFKSLVEANRLDNLITLCPNCHQRAETVVKVRSGLSGLCYALQNLAPLFLMCDMDDLGAQCDPVSPLGDGNPTIIIYDQVPGGIGLSETLFQIYPQLIERAYELISTCPCVDGCPSCVGPGGENGTGSKHETLAILSILKEEYGIDQR